MFCVCFFLVFFSFMIGSFSSRRLVEWRCFGLCHRWRAGRIFIFSLFLMPGLRYIVGFGERRTPQSRSSSSSDLTVPCIGRSGQRWPVVTITCLGSFLFGLAWWPRSAFSCCAGVATEAVVADLLQGDSEDDTCPTQVDFFPTKTGSFAADLVWTCC
jgi:hypothetical protein